MHLSIFSFLVATFIAVANSIPVAPQQAILEIKRSEADVTQLLAYIVQSNTKAAKTEYATIQKELDDLGYYLGQLSAPTCVSSGPSSNTTSATSQTDVLVTLQQLQLDIIDISAGIINSNPSAAVSAWSAAQRAFESTYNYIFA